MSTPSPHATFFLLFLVLVVFGAFAALSRGPDQLNTTPLRSRTAATTTGLQPDVTFILVASSEQAARANSTMAAKLSGEVQVRLIGSPADEERLVADAAELNGFRTQLGLPEVRILDLR